MPCVPPPPNLSQEALQRCVEVFGRERLVVFSNSAGSVDDVGHAAARSLEHSLGLPVLRHTQKKPLGFDSVMQHFRESTAGLAESVTDGAQLTMVGDRYFTDILFGNIHGMLTIHTSSFSSNGEVPVVRAIRGWEERYVLWLMKNGVRPAPHPLCDESIIYDKAKVHYDKEIF